MPVHRKNKVKKVGFTIAPLARDKKPRTEAQKAKDRLALSDGHRAKTAEGHGRFKIDKRQPSKPTLQRDEAQRAANTADYWKEMKSKGELKNKGLKGKKRGKYTKTRRDI